jgi:acetylornithine aminotransferase
MNTYARQPISFSRGEGALLMSEQGDTYLDAVSGIAVCSLGHAHPAITETICQQAGQLIHTSNLYNVDKQTQLANELCDLSGMDQVFFTNSGAEANEAALKIARKFANQNGIKNHKVITMNQSFHGRTLATLSATGNEKVHQDFYPLVDDYIRVDFNDIEAVKQHADNPSVVAILVEPIQGEGGVFTPNDGYLTALRKICDDNSWLLMIDEIQTGMGRTGKWFGFQHDAIQPDVVTLAKALGNGMPIGACLTSQKANAILVPGNHGTTFGGNPLACAVGLTVIETITNNQYIKKIAQNNLINQFESALKNNLNVINIRGKGYMIGIQLNTDCTHLIKLALEEMNLLINVTHGDTIRLLPAFVMTELQQEELITKVVNLIEQV